jgi:hypothetical protein
MSFDWNFLNGGNNPATAAAPRFDFDEAVPVADMTKTVATAKFTDVRNQAKERDAAFKPLAQFPTNNASGTAGFVACAATGSNVSPPGMTSKLTNVAGLKLASLGSAVAAASGESDVKLNALPPFSPPGLTTGIMTTANAAVASAAMTLGDQSKQIHWHIMHQRNEILNYKGLDTGGIREAYLKFLETQIKSIYPITAASPSTSPLHKVNSRWDNVFLKMWSKKDSLALAYINGTVQGMLGGVFGSAVATSFSKSEMGSDTYEDVLRYMIVGWLRNPLAKMAKPAILNLADSECVEDLLGRVSNKDEKFLAPFLNHPTGHKLTEEQQICQGLIEIIISGIPKNPAFFTATIIPMFCQIVRGKIELVQRGPLAIDKVMDLHKDNFAMLQGCAEIRQRVENYVTAVSKLSYKEAEQLCVDLRDMFYDACFDVIEEA